MQVLSKRFLALQKKSNGKKSCASVFGSHKKTAKKETWEKNVRRRVYDALNVLYAAGVLRKEDKHVFCNNNVDVTAEPIMFKSRGITLSNQS